MNRNENTIDCQLANVGASDVASMDDVIHAVGAWSHLAVFSQVHRPVMAARCGLAVSVEKILSLSLFFVSDKKLARVACRYLASTGQLALWEPSSSNAGEGGFGEQYLRSLPGQTKVCAYTEGFAETLARESGWCYVGMPLEKGGCIGDVGAWPSMRSLVTLGVSMEALLDTVYVGPGMFHRGAVPSVGGGRRGSVDAAFQQAVQDASGGVLVPEEGGVAVVFPDPSDPTTCKCSVHRAPNREGDAGCAVAPAGTHPVLRAADEGRFAVCHASPAVREMDEALGQLLATGCPGMRAYASSSVPTPAKVFLACNAAPVEGFGAGYCYLKGMRGKARWPVARALGPDAPLQSVLAALRVFGAQDPRVEVVPVGPGRYHLQAGEPGGVGGRSGAALFDKLSRIARAEPAAVIGTGRGEVVLGALRGQESGFGPGALSASFETDLALAFTPASSVDSAQKVRKRMLEVVGDAALTLACSIRVFRGGGGVQAYQEQRSARLSNRALGAVFEATAMYARLGLPPSSRGTVTSAKACEALAGVVFLTWGVAGVETLADAIGIWGA